MRAEIDRRSDFEREQERIEETLEFGSKAQLLDLRNEVVERLDRIKGDVAAAKRRARAERVYADHEWLTRAERAQRYYARVTQRLQERLGQLARLEKAKNIAAQAAHEETREVRFVKAAKRLLDEVTYRSIWAEAARGEVGNG